MRFLKELRRVAGEKVEVVHPRGRRGLEDVAPDEVVLLVDQKLPGIRLVERVVACSTMKRNQKMISKVSISETQATLLSIHRRTSIYTFSSLRQTHPADPVRRKHIAR